MSEQNEHFKSETKKEKAFESKGVAYYHFTDGGTPIYYKRFQAFQDKMSKSHEWKISDAVLTEYTDMVRKFTQTGGNLSDERKLAEIARLTDNLEWRRQQSNDVALVYEIAAVWYFDETEDPADYSEDYAKEKIHRWMEDSELFAFFLRTPLNRYIDFSGLSDPGMQTYLKAMYQAAYEQSKSNFLRLSESERESEIGQNILLVAESYLALMNLIDLGLLNTTTS